MSRINRAFWVAGGSAMLAWSLGSTVIAVAAVAVGVAATAATAWRTLVRRRVEITRVMPRGRLVEGDTLRYQVRHSGARLPGTFVLQERIARIGVREVELRRGGETDTILEDAPRGRLTFGPSMLLAEDPFGLERVVAPCTEVSQVVVRPRLPRIGALQTDGPGACAPEVAVRLRQPSGSELHGVREYRAGEPMRAVHWASTARRGRLMVRELEDPSADDVEIVLDLDARADLGRPGRSSLDEAVRVGGALAVAHNARGRTVRLTIAAAAPKAITIRSPGDLETMLDLLAVAEPRARGGWWTAGTGRTGPTVLVTARAESASRTDLRLDAVVLIDAVSYGDESRLGSTAPLLGLVGRGATLAVVRAGDDIAEVLAGRMSQVARG